MVARRRGFWLPATAALLAATAGALWQMPLGQALRWMPAATKGALHVDFAQGVWHDGVFALGCTTPNGRTYDCGRYALLVKALAGGADDLLKFSATQPGGGSIQGQWGIRDWHLELSRARLPMAALAIALPIVEQMQLGGDVWVDGRIAGSGKVSLALRWQSEFGEFPTGEQKVRIEGAANRYELKFLPPDPLDGPARVSMQGKVDCDFVAGRAGARCRGEVEVQTDRSVPKLEGFLAAVAPQVTPGRYRVRVDAQ